MLSSGLAPGARPRTGLRPPGPPLAGPPGSRRPTAGGRARPWRRGRPWGGTGRPPDSRRSTPDAPKASADRNSVPALPGSLRSARSSAGPRISSASGAQAQRRDRHDAGRRLDVGDLAGLRGRRQVDRGAGRFDSRRPAARLVGRLGHVEFEDRTPPLRASPSRVAPSNAKRCRLRRPLTLESARISENRSECAPSERALARRARGALRHQARVRIMTSRRQCPRTRSRSCR